MELKLDSITDFLEGQEWYQQLKSKWEELDPQSRLYLKIAGAVAVGIAFLFLIISSAMSVQQQKQELTRKKDLLTMIQSASEEIRSLHESGVPTEIAPGGGAWDAYFQTIAANSGIDKDNLTISDEKAGPTGDMAKESMFDLTLKKSTIRQVVKLAYFLENGTRPVKLRDLSVETHADPAGYVDATLSVSAFSPAEKRGGR